MAEFDPFQLLYVVIAVGAIVAGVWQGIHILVRQLREQIYLDYTGRYGQTLDKLPPGAITSKFKVEQAKENRKDWERVLSVMNQYFDLCSEEFKLNDRGLVLPDVWSDWLDGITAAMSAPLCQEMWKQAPFADGYDTMKVSLQSRGVSIPDMVDR